MSTKIYDAFILDKSIKNLNDIAKFNQTLKEEIEKDAICKITLAAAKRIQTIYDLYSFYGDTIFRKKNINLKEEQKKAIKYLIDNKDKKEDDKLRHLYFDEIYDNYPKVIKELEDISKLHKVEILYFPCGRKILAMIFGDRDYFNHFYNNELLKDYHYQNQTDRPEGITAAEYRQRDKDWEKAIGPDYIPINHGLGFTLLNYSDGTGQLQFKMIKQDLTHTVQFEPGKTCVKKAFESVVKDYTRRTRIIRESMNCPLLKDCKTYSDFLDIKDTKQYKNWVKRQNKKIREKMLFPEEKE